MDADTKALIGRVREMRARQTRFDVCGDDRDLYAKRYAERQVDEWIASLYRRGEPIAKCEHGIDAREHCPRCSSLRKRHKKMEGDE